MPVTIYNYSDHPDAVGIGGLNASLDVAQTEVMERLIAELPQQSGTVLLTHEHLDSSETICRELIRRLPPTGRVGWVLHPRLSLLDFMRAVCHAFRVHGNPKEESALDLLEGKLQAHLDDSARSGKTSILVIGNAHTTPFFALNHLAKFNASGTEGQTRMLVILIGHHSLIKQLAQPELAVTQTSICARYELDKLEGTAPMPLDSDWLSAPSTLSPPDNDGFAPPFGSRPEAAPHHLEDWSATDEMPSSRAPGLNRRQSLSEPGSGFAEWIRSIPAWRRPELGIGAIALLLLLVWWLWPQAEQADRVSHLTPAPMVVREAAVDQRAAPASRESAGTVLEAPSVSPAVAIPPALDIPQTAATDASPSPVAPSPSGSSIGPAPLLSELVDDQAMTWPLLGKLWGITMSNGDSACDEALRQGVQCYRSNDLNFDQVRAIDRPAMLLLHQAGTDKWVRLLAMDATHARLASSGQEWVVPLADLRQLWRSGALATLWRLPPGQTRRVFNAALSEPSGQWLHEQLKAMQAAGQLDANATNYTARVIAFQTAHGLRNDGRATPTTFVLINRMRGVDEPDLRGAVR